MESELSSQANPQHASAFNGRALFEYRRLGRYSTRFRAEIGDHADVYHLADEFNQGLGNDDRGQKRHRIRDGECQWQDNQGISSAGAKDNGAHSTNVDTNKPCDHPTNDWRQYGKGNVDG